jgi:hypothetical protein
MVLVGGRHRSLTEFRKLAAQSGLAIVAAGQQANYYVVECRATVMGRPEAYPTGTAPDPP